MNRLIFFKVEIKKNYKETQWRDDIKKLLSLFTTEEEEAQQGVTFMVTSNQIKYDSFLEDINNLLNCGEVPNLYEAEEMEDILLKTKELAKKKGIVLTRKEDIWNYFVERVRNKLHIVLTFSPVGDTFRNKCR